MGFGSCIHFNIEVGPPIKNSFLAVLVALDPSPYDADGELFDTAANVHKKVVIGGRGGGFPSVVKAAVDIEAVDAEFQSAVLNAVNIAQNLSGGDQPRHTGSFGAVGGDIARWR